MKVEIELACAGYNFGSANHERLIRDAMLKQAIGFCNGYTVNTILFKLGFITADFTPTPKGRDYLAENFLSLPADMDKPIDQETK